jgi:hypothetical protein
MHFHGTVCPAGGTRLLKKTVLPLPRLCFTFGFAQIAIRDPLLKRPAFQVLQSYPIPVGLHSRLLSNSPTRVTPQLSFECVTEEWSSNNSIADIRSQSTRFAWSLNSVFMTLLMRPSPPQTATKPIAGTAQCTFQALMHVLLFAINGDSHLPSYKSVDLLVFAG